jgi:predicted Ser/Thr protein kinase
MALKPGSRAGPYVIERQLGRGGMASVYLAYDTALDRRVALKVLPREFLHDPDFIGRFRIEARAVASLEHPNIIPIYSYDVDQEEGIPWMAMRLISGGSLSDLIKKDRPLLERSVQILRGLADALDYAHTHPKKIVHRDIKPQNVLLDDAGRVYLADFGVVKMLESPSGLTATGMITGTPQYMAPEQATGTSVDHRADIYALGIVAYELFVGHVPFSADTPVGIMMKHVQEPIPLPAAGQVPEPLVRALLKALAKQPEDRWPTATAFVSALEAGLRSASTSMPMGVGPPTVDLERVDRRAVTPPTRVTPPPARTSRVRAVGRFVFRMGLAAAFGITLAIAGLVWLRREQPPTPSTPAPIAVASPPPADFPGVPIEAPVVEPSAPPITVAAVASAAPSPPAHTPQARAVPMPTPTSARPTPTAEPVVLAKATLPPIAELPRPTPPAVSPVVQGLLQSLSAPDVATRWRAAEALGNLGQEAEPAVAALTSALRDRSPDVRWRAAEALGKIGAPAASAVPSVAVLLRDPDDLVRGEAAKALGRFGAAAGPAVSTLAEGLLHPQVSFRREVAKALALIGPEAHEAVPALTAALRDKDKFVRMHAARALGNIGPAARSALTALTTASRDPEDLVARQAKESLKKVGAE